MTKHAWRSCTALGLLLASAAAGPLTSALAQSNTSPPATTPPMSATAGPAESAQPVFGPPDAWVRPSAIPSAPALPDANASSNAAPFLNLLLDQQSHLEQGRQTTYVEMAGRIQTPAGLNAGNISIPWRPQTDVLTVHKLVIRRGGQTIDALASGQTFTVMRREQNLEMAMLDGVLTANIQPEGLQVGDIIDLAYSISVRDPVLGPHVETPGALWNIVPITRAHLSVQWPNSIRMNTRVTAALPGLNVTHTGSIDQAELTLNEVRPLSMPRGAPPRYMLGRMVEFSSFQNWSELAAMMAPLYDRASQLPADGPLRAEVQRIGEASTDPVTRAEAALALVQDHIRYVALAMGDAGLIPADAQTTWARRYGDCKGKTALLLGILHAFNIEAQPVLVSTVFGDGLDQHIAMIGLFNHVLVRATINGRTYWLDGTRTGDTRLDDIVTPSFGWGLPVQAEGATLVRMVPAPLDRPYQSTSIQIDASAGILTPAPIHVELVVHGDAAVASNLSFANLSGEARDSALRQYWRQHYDDVTVRAATQSFDPARREARFVMDGDLHMDWSDGYRVDHVALGYRADLSRDPGPDREAPFAVAYPFFNAVHETITLPRGQTFQVHGGEPVNETVGGITYQRHANIANGVLVVDQSERSMAAEFPFAEAAAAESRLRALNDQVLYLSTGAYQLSQSDLQTERQATPSDVAGFVRRAAVYLDSNQPDEAMADIDHALALDPHNANALALRGVAHAEKNELDAAQIDVNAATAIDPHNGIALRAASLVALQSGRTAEAIATLNRAISADPDNSDLLAIRAEAYHTARDEEHALADSETALRRGANLPNMHLLRANIFLSRSDEAHAISEADALAGDASMTAYGHVIAARIYARAHRHEDAMREFDRALTGGPQAYIYYNRAEIRPASDLAGRLADANAALALEPDMTLALQLKADVLEQQHNYAGAITALSDAIRVSPTDADVFARRGVAYARAGQASLAEADFAAARTHASSAYDFNSLCWRLGVANTSLDAALAACNSALALAPRDANIMDSKAFILLRLGRLDEAIALYSEALALSPRLPASLYGRGLAYDRKGDHQHASVDFAAALAADSDVRTDFASYGLTPSQ